MKVFIVEDNIHQLEEIKKYVSNYSELEIAGTSRNGLEALEMLRQSEVDLILLDISLPGCSGIEIMEALEPFPYVIFITAYDHYAVRAFEMGAIDYLLKPVSSGRMNKAIRRFLEFHNVGKNQPPISTLGISFKSEGSVIFMAYNDIVYLTATNKNTVVHTRETDFEASCLLGDFEAKLPTNLFLRIHRKYVINMSCISFAKSKFSSLYIILNDGDDTMLPISRTYQLKVKKNLLMVPQKN